MSNDDIDYRELADSLLVAALEAIDSVGSTAQLDECAAQRDSAIAALEQARADVRLAKAERDDAIKERKVLEQEVAGDQAQARATAQAAANMQTELRELRDRLNRLEPQLQTQRAENDRLKTQLRDALIQTQAELKDNMSPAARGTLRRLLAETGGRNGKQR